MRYIKLYENFFDRMSLIDKSKIDLYNDVSTEILDLIPDIQEMDNFAYRTEFKYSANMSKNIFDFKIDFKNNNVFVGFDPTFNDYKDVVISNLYRVESILSVEYDVLYNIRIGDGTAWDINKSNLSIDGIINPLLHNT